MAVQVARVIAEVRRLTQDSGYGQDQRSSDVEIRGAMNLALSDMRRARPDYFLGNLAPLVDVQDAVTISVDDYMFTPICMVTAGYLLMEVDEYSDDGTARNFVALGRQQMGGTP